MAQKVESAKCFTKGSNRIQDWEILCQFGKGFVVEMALKQSHKVGLGFGEEGEAWGKPAAGKPTVAETPLLLPLPLGAWVVAHLFIQLTSTNRSLTGYQAVRSSSFPNLYKQLLFYVAGTNVFGRQRVRPYRTRNKGLVNVLRKALSCFLGPTSMEIAPWDSNADQTTSPLFFPGKKFLVTNNWTRQQKLQYGY